jgi:hypothetical protein
MNRSKTLGQTEDNIRVDILDIGTDMMKKVDRNLNSAISMLTRTVVTFEMFLKLICTAKTFCVIFFYI